MQHTQSRKIKWWLMLLPAALVLIFVTLYYWPLWRTRHTKMAAVQITPQLIQRGAYLANHVAVCMDCHARRDWTRYSGPPIVGTEGTGGEVFDRSMGFPGVFYAKNITSGRLGNWTNDELLRAFTTGVKPDGEVLFPVMPYPNFRHLDPRDAAAIVAYIRTLPASGKQTPDRTIGFSLRILLRTLVKPAAFETMPPATDRVAYGRYLTTIAGCATCHTPQTNGQIDTGRLFAGGRRFKMRAAERWSPNITPDSVEGIGAWREEDFVRKFKYFEDSAHVARLGPGEKNTVMPWSMYSGMDSADLGAIYAYLRSLPPAKEKRVTSAGQ